MIDLESKAPAQPTSRKPVARSSPVKETEIQRAILAALRIHPMVKRVERTNTGAGRFVGKDGKAGRFVRFGFPGQSDISGFLIDGRQMAIEVKTPARRNLVSVQQLEYLSDILDAGGVAGVATSVEEACAIVERLT